MVELHAQTFLHKNAPPPAFPVADPAHLAHNQKITHERLFEQSITQNRWYSGYQQAH
jgi:hypothetical protein